MSKAYASVRGWTIRILRSKQLFYAILNTFETQALCQFPGLASPIPGMFIGKSNTAIAPSSEIVAAYIDHELELKDSHQMDEWQNAIPVTFCADWQGKNADPGRETQVRVLWSWQSLYLRFDCRYRELFIFEDSDASGRRDHLWDRDVAEAFLQPDPSRERFYCELEVSRMGCGSISTFFPAGGPEKRFAAISGRG